MESVQALQTIARQKALLAFLQEEKFGAVISVQAMLGDASFRCYFRVLTDQGSFVAMDAPLPFENCHAFVSIANALRELGLCVPVIYKADLQQGFLLLSDFGDTTYLKALNAATADQLYQSALQSLSVLQNCKRVNDFTLPFFNADLMWKEWQWHQEWFLEKFLGLSQEKVNADLTTAYGVLVESAISQPQVFMHRDFHSANLMVLPANQVGILDFQDAFIGPVTYDLVSLLKDCYIDWPQEHVKRWALQYHESLQALNSLPRMEGNEFLRWFDLMGVQRHLKALLTFARKHVRDQQSQYLQHIPRTLSYILQACVERPELKAMHHFYYHEVLPLAQEKIFACAR